MVTARQLPDAPADPVGRAVADIGGHLDPSWFLLGLLIPLAIVVLWFGNRRLRDLRRPSTFEPRGRRDPPPPSAPPADWLETRARLLRNPAIPIAEARAGPVKVRGTVTRATETLGGPPQRACIYRNRAGASPAAAAAAEACVVRDASGVVGVEQLAGAVVDAPAEPVRHGHAAVALYVGDEVEILGTFVPEVFEGPSPRDTVYGTIGSRGPLEIRVLGRPSPDPAARPPAASRIRA